MTDPTQTPIPPTDQTTPPQAPVSDFFGGSEEAFQRKDVFRSPDVAEVQEPAFDVSIPEYEEVESGGSAVEPAAARVESEEHILETKNEPIKEEVIEKIPEPVKQEVFEPIIEPEPIPEPEEIKISEPSIETPQTPAGSDIAIKFDELFQVTKKIYDMKKTSEGFEIIGANNDTLSITYKFFLGDEEYPMVSITKLEINKSDDEESTHELSFYLNEKGTAVNVNLDEELLFDEEEDLQDDPKKKMQVMDKLNKFIFLVSEEARKLEKEIKEKEAAEQEKRKLQDIFRNF